MGVCSPVGVGAAQTFAAVRARVSGATELPGIYYCLPELPHFEDGEPLIGSAIRHLSGIDQTEPEMRLARIAAEAFRDLERGVDALWERHSETGLFLSLPVDLIGSDSAREKEFVYNFHNFIEKDLYPRQRFQYSGRTGGLFLIEEACGALGRGEINRAIVGGVDSYFFPDRLERLDREYRIKSARNIDGFIPGEAAAFLLLERTGESKALPMAEIGDSAKAKCEASDLAQGLGQALSRIAASLLDVCKEPPVMVCDLNGEPPRMKEWAYALTRLGERAAKMPMELPVAVLGDVGAASGPVLTALAAFYLKKKHARRANAFVWCASDSGDRVGLLVNRS